MVSVPLLALALLGFPCFVRKALVLFCVVVGLLGKNKAVGVLLSSLVQSFSLAIKWVARTTQAARPGGKCLDLLSHHTGQIRSSARTRTQDC